MAKIVAATRNEEIRGYQIKKELGWLTVDGCSSPRDFEERIKIKAAAVGANALVKMHWKIVKETYEAGVGARGNPYFQSETLYDGEALAVYVEPNAKKQKIESTKIHSAKPPPTKPTGFSSGWVAIDGNNVFGKLYGANQDFDDAFRIINAFLLQLKASPYKPQMFWDGKFISFARAVGMTDGNEKLEDVLLRRLCISRDELTISDFGVKADSLIVSWAFQRSAAAISGDTFSKSIEDAIILNRSKILSEQGLLLKYEVIARGTVVPELSSI